MQNQNLDETQPSRPLFRGENDDNDSHLEETQRSFVPLDPPPPDPEEFSQTPPPEMEDLPSPRRRLLRQISIGIGIFFLIVALGAVVGWQWGTNDRLAQ